MMRCRSHQRARTRAIPAWTTLVALLGAVAACSAPPTAIEPKWLALDVVMDSSVFRYGEPVAWRADLRTTQDTPINLTLPSWVDGFGYRMFGPEGEVARRGISFLVIGGEKTIEPGERASRLGDAIMWFITDTTSTRMMLPVLPPGRYELVVRFVGDARMGEQAARVTLEQHRWFQVMGTQGPFRDSVDGTGSRFAELQNGLEAGTVTASQVAGELKRTVEEAGFALWTGALLLNVGSLVQVRRTATEGDVIPMVKELMGRYARAHAARAFAASLAWSLDSLRLAELCGSMAAEGPLTPNMSVVCQRR